MKRPVLAIYDVKAKLFQMPMFPAAVGQVLREFSDLVNDGKSAYAKHPEDYQLFQLGFYDDVEGRFESNEFDAPKLVQSASACVVSDPNQLKLLREEA